MRITSHVVRITCIALASTALFVPAATAAQFDYYIKLPPIEGDSGKSRSQEDKHKNQIEILSWSWGETRSADALTDGLLILRNADEPSESAGKVSKVEAINIKQSMAAAKGEKGGTEDINIGVGELQEAPRPSTPPTVTLKRGTRAASPKKPITKPGLITPRPLPGAAASGGVSVAAGDVTGDGSTEAPRKPTRTLATLTPKASESGLPTGKRQHKPMTFAAPLDRGSVTLRMTLAGCAVGARYPTAELATSSGRYMLENVVISSCGPATAGAMPMEEVSFNYAKISPAPSKPPAK